MFASHIRVVLLVAAVASATMPAWGETLEIGQAAPDFRLPGVDGKTCSLADFAQADVLVVVFTCNHCPTAQAYEGRIKQLAADYKDRKVALVAVSPNDPLAVRPDELGYTDLNDSLEEMKLRAKDQAFNFPYLYDGEDQKFSRACGAVATPHALVFDRDRKLRYSGRIDESERTQKPASPDLRNAIEAVLTGKPVPVERTRPFGCSVKWAAKRAQAAKSAQAAANEPVTVSALDEAGLRELARGEGAKLRLVHVWALGEKPAAAPALADLAAMNQMYRRRGLEPVTISADPADRRDAVLKALQAGHVSGRNCILDAAKDKLKTLDEKFDGALPHTVLIAPGGKVVWRQSGPLDALAARRAIVGILGRTYK
ncbi:MAG: thiol-disulfide oxidoreductase [Planctomycetes bacterium ADurb.Bin126]|nr:MAG: thiol-disulfide oxidoreductase [Planctomycetes bacterium ADurb.Bin126]HOD84148.1 redoxin domain-containing protein [Phycisphaerae bacterium]HQL73036.1 redoxin domain-containing protein [Phycisphaerae bacterium]